MKTLILALFILLGSPLFMGFAAAQDTEKTVETEQAANTAQAPVLPSLGTTPDDARPLRPAMNDRSVRSIDDLRLQLSNGRIVQLVGIEVPRQTGYSSGDESYAVKQFLDTLFANSKDSDVIVYQVAGSGSGKTNRMGHDLGHVVRKNGNVWIQGALIANGLAMARPTPTNPELADKMYALEDQARQAKLGIWSDDSAHRLVEASDTIQPLDRFAVVEGTVKNVSIIRNVTYLNFGDDYRKDFTIGIPSTQRQAMSRAGIDPFKLQGQKVRVRGWLRLYNGPYIELEHPVLFQQVKNEQNATAKP